jgi:putative oxidoreductase
MGTLSDDIAKLVLRITVGGLMLFHGIAKIMSGIGWLGSVVGGAGLPEFVKWGVYLGEVVGPILLILGFQARIGALLVMADMLFALILVHSHQILTLGPAGGWAVELPMFFFLAALAVFFAGPGKYSVAKSEWPAWNQSLL